MWSWLQRHKKKFIFLAVIAGGAYAGGRYLLKKASVLQQWPKQPDQLDVIRFKEHFESNKQTCSSAVLSLVPTVKDTVCTHLDAEAITAKLRERPANKVTLWEDLKIISFTRLVAGVYSCCLLTVFLRVQLSILGGCMFLDLQTHQEESSGRATAQVQKQYLSTVQYLLKDGLLALIQTVRESAEAILTGYSLKHQLSYEGVLQLISDIRIQAAAPPQHTSDPKSFLVQYLLPKEPLLQSRGSQVDTLLAATRDILESGDFSEVLESSVEHGFAQLGRSVMEAYHSAAQSSPTLPLARVIPVITDHSHIIFDTHQPNPFMQTRSFPDACSFPSPENEQASGDEANVIGAKGRDLLKLSENIYEAFGH